MSTRYAKVKIAGHPVHPMLIAFPVTFYTSTLVAFVVYAISGDAVSWQIALRANVAGVVMAVVAALPGFIDWRAGIPSNTPAKRTGKNHMLLNLGSLALFVINLIVQRNHWNTGELAGTNNAPPVGAAIVLSALGVLCMLGAGFLGWSLVQTHHVGVDLTDEQQRLDANRSMVR